MNQTDDAKRVLFVEVTVVTTSGQWPPTGADKVPAEQPVQVQLKKAAEHLHITDTTGWIATVAGREIDIQKNYIENRLLDTAVIVIDYGPREGGGGNA